jgi:hypothetical protein
MGRKRDIEIKKSTSKSEKHQKDPISLKKKENLFKGKYNLIQSYFGAQRHRNV